MGDRREAIEAIGLLDSQVRWVVRDFQSEREVSGCIARRLCISCHTLSQNSSNIFAEQYTVDLHTTSHTPRHIFFISSGLISTVTSSKVFLNITAHITDIKRT